MAIKIGTDRISDIQRAYLERYRDTDDLEQIAELLYRVVSDDDIESGLEDLHPNWISIFDQHRARLERAQAHSAGRLFGYVCQAFAALSTSDALISKIDPREEQVAFLLGAGASKPSPSDIPTVTELLPQLLERARRLDREQVNSLADFCHDQNIDNIEDLLTAVLISDFCSRNTGILSLVEFQLFGNGRLTDSRRRSPRRPIHTDVSSVAYLQDTLQVLFALLSNLMLPASPNEGHKAIVDYLRDKPSTPIVTTNYDCCIDRALISSGIPFDYTVDFANQDLLPKAYEPFSSLIKLHGSLNWFYCETCQEVRLIDIEQTVSDYNNQRGEYPIISVCSVCGGQRRALLVPPYAMKFDVAPPLQPLIATAASSFDSRDLIVVVGFSFADADLYISRMLIKAMQASSETRLLIVDPDHQVAERVRRKFAVQIPDFDSWARILWLKGDCSEVLPQFLRGELYQASANGEPEQANNDHLESSPTLSH